MRPGPTQPAGEQPPSDVAFGTADDLETAAQGIESATGMTFDWRSSAFCGGSYLVAGDWLEEPDAEQVIVQPNLTLDGRAESTPFPTIVYVEYTRRPDELISTLTATGLTLIWHRASRSLAGELA
jgi:hypothetical protein